MWFYYPVAFPRITSSYRKPSLRVSDGRCFNNLWLRNRVVTITTEAKYTHSDNGLVDASRLTIEVRRRDCLCDHWQTWINWTVPATLNDASSRRVARKKRRNFTFFYFSQRVSASRRWCVLISFLWETMSLLLAGYYTNDKKVKRKKYIFKSREKFRRATRRYFFVCMFPQIIHFCAKHRYLIVLYFAYANRIIYYETYHNSPWEYFELPLSPPRRIVGVEFTLRRTSFISRRKIETQGKRGRNTPIRFGLSQRCCIRGSSADK